MATTRGSVGALGTVAVPASTAPAAAASTGGKVAMAWQLC